MGLMVVTRIRAENPSEQRRVSSVKSRESWKPCGENTVNRGKRRWMGVEPTWLRKTLATHDLKSWPHYRGGYTSKRDHCTLPLQIRQTRCAVADCPAPSSA